MWDERSPIVLRGSWDPSDIDALEYTRPKVGPKVCPPLCYAARGTNGLSPSVIRGSWDERSPFVLRSSWDRSDIDP